METTRIATVKATGRRYVIQQIDFRTDKVHCWGELKAYTWETQRGRGRVARQHHVGAKAFSLSEVIIQNEVPRDETLLQALFAQAKAAAAAGELGRLR